jgi:predicted transcriptional regulator
MDKALIFSIIRAVTLNQRRVNYQFKKDNDLNPSHIEILSFANLNTCFNPYNVQQFYKQMNLQQVRSGIKKLACMGAIELIGRGKKGNPAIYMISNKGLKLLEDYGQSMINKICPDRISIF